MEACRFCSISQHKLDAAIVFEDESVIAFMDKYPLVDGHLLVVPKKHFESFIDLDHESAFDLVKVIGKLEKALMDGVGCEGVDLRQHFRPFLPESTLVLRHLHLHLVPRRMGDDLYDKALKHEGSLRREPSLVELTSLASKIKARIR
ncbi:HIT domain-containing protein [Candidatus Micrarchaeota archaeon]|nr:HIT domain-containing protein [Candidatus Micrarchaeota archaeon]